jgi:uncharacterized protein (TIGR02328 family)
MRIWHEELIPKLCRQHLLAVWREGLGCLKIITENKAGYRNHPATQEFINAPRHLLKRLHMIRSEMLKRGYHPKEMPSYVILSARREIVKQWQSLDEQIARLKEKKCNCKI